MDKTTKFILGLIAVALIGINVQMWDGKLIKPAYAKSSCGSYTDPCYVKQRDDYIKTVCWFGKGGC